MSESNRAGPATAPAPPAPLTPGEIWESVPSWEEIFDRPPDPVTPIECPDTEEFRLADRKCARLLANTCFCDPPITEEEIKAFALRAGVPEREAELELRRLRNG